MKYAVKIFPTFLQLFYPNILYLRVVWLQFLKFLEPQLHSFDTYFIENFVI